MTSVNPGALWLLLLLAIAGLVVFVLRRRRSTATAPSRRDRRLDVPPPPGGPQVGERWKAEVPYEDEPHRSKHRPCLVIGYSGTGYWVLRCTTQAPREAEWRVPVPVGKWNPPADRDGFVDLIPYHLPAGRFEHSFGRIANAALYRKITGDLRWERAVDFTR